MALDHLLGRPSSNWKRLEAILIIFAVFSYVKRNDQKVPKVFERLNKALGMSILMMKGNLLPWQVMVFTLLGRYVISKMFLLLNLNAPEVYAKHYNRNFYRATWILTALDAGFWTAMHIKPAPLKHLCSILFSIWYLFRPEAADIKVRKLRAISTVQMMRIAWEKATTPFLFTVGFFQRDRIGMVKELFIERNPESATLYPNWKSKIRVKLYFHGTEKELQKCRHLILHFPGGGFVTMQPEHHEEYIRKWAKRFPSKVLICSVDYGKAPEYVFPYAIDECFELYEKIIRTNGHCLGMNLQSPVEDEDWHSAPESPESPQPKKYKKLRVILCGDSAGGNFVVAVTTKIILHNKQLEEKQPKPLPIQLQFTSTGKQQPTTDQDSKKKKFLRKPDGLVVIYGALNFDMASWIAPADEEASLLRPESTTSLNSLMKPSKGKKYHPDRLISSQQNLSQARNTKVEQFPGIDIPYLSFTSRISYFNDRIITPEMQRGMALLYLGSNCRLNPATDYLLSPVVTPEEILMEFPKLYMQSGELDPFVDDTVILSARVRAAIEKKMKMTEEDLASDSEKESQYDPKEEVERDKEEEREHLTLDYHPKSLLESLQNRLYDWLGIPLSLSNDHLSETEEKLSTDTEEDIYYDYHQSEDENNYGNLTSTEHVTVKIYAGLSHAYLNMLNMLPEAHHAVKLTSDWFEEIFNSREEIQKRRRLKRKRSLKAIAKMMRVGMEMRDEDNIPNTIDLPLGAEYRLGRTQIEIKNEKSFQKQFQQQQQQKPKYFIGTDSDNEEQSPIEEGDVPVFEGEELPLHKAMLSSKRNLYKLSKSPTKEKPLQKQKKKINGKKEKEKEEGKEMFMSEFDVVNKRRANLVRDVYLGVEEDQE